MKMHIIVEGPSDKEFVEKLLSDLPDATKRRIEAADGKDAARPIVRKHLLRVGEPTAFVFDTDTTDRSRVQEQVRDLEDYFRWGSPSVPFKMVPMVPSLEVLFFERPSTIERHMGKPLDATTKRAGVHAPKEVLEEILHTIGVASILEFFRSLTREDLEDLRQQETIAGLRRFIQDAFA